MKSSYPLGNWEGKRVNRSASQETCLEKERITASEGSMEGSSYNHI